MDIKKKVKEMPLTAGVYIMKSAKGEVLYVGKASSLRKRVGSYFSSQNLPKTAALLEHVGRIDYIECQSSQQALMLEAALIKEKKPKYNIALRDNKSYPYVEVTNEKFARVHICRPKKKTNSALFGPYTETRTLKSALTMIRRIFPYRSCGAMPKTACLFYHLKLCPAPCAGNISASSYRGAIESICKMLNGQRKELVKDLKKKMKEAAGRKDFEEAARLRDKLSAVESLYEGRPRTHEIISLKEVLNLPRLPLVIEAFDISSLAGADAVGSSVYFRGGAADKSNYRRFLIKEAKQRDDYAMIVQVLRRRYSRLIKEKKKLPDLIIVDGGKGHVMAGHRELKTLGVFVPIIGIAKRNEEIWFPFKEKPLIISKDSPSLHLIQRIRDEAHRFAHKYHLYRRGLALDKTKK